MATAGYKDMAPASDTRPGTDQARRGEGSKGEVWGLPSQPDTMRYAVPTDLDRYIKHPEVPRANKAISKENPNGSPSHLAREDYTVMQQHCAFFDRDEDGVLWPMDTFVGFRRLGFGYIISTLAVPFIHGSFSYPTQDSWIPDPFFRINLKRIHRGKHGSDSEVYDKEGRFQVENFEQLFTKYDRSGKGGLSWDDVTELVWHHQDIFDPTGWIAERLEWYVFWLLAADENGIISKEKIRGQYDGSLWYIIAEENERKHRLGHEARTNGPRAKTM